MNNEFTIQTGLAGLLTVAGLALLAVGLSYPPSGEIHSSLLVAFGEICTFAGALCGVDLYYKKGPSQPPPKGGAKNKNE